MDPSLGEYCFNKCSFLREILIPDSVKTIGKYCFNECTRLKKINILAEITSINNSTFRKCSLLEKFSIPSSTIREITISESINTISDVATSVQMKFTLNFNSLKSLPFQNYNKDFTFIVDGKSYPTARVVADILSPKVRKLHFIDSSITEFNIDTTDNQELKQKGNEERDYFNDCLKPPTTDEIDIDDTQRKYYSAYFYKLGNINEFLQCQPEYLTPLSIENAIDCLLTIENLMHSNSEPIDRSILDIEQIISFVTSPFYEIPKESLQKLSSELLKDIIESENLHISDEDSILNFLID